MLDALLDRISQSPKLTRAATPLVRSYLRYTPWEAGKWEYWNRVVQPYFAWNSYDFVARTRFGSRIAGNTLDLIQQYLYFTGVWEPQLTHWVQERLAPGDGFIDIGANIGYFTLLASRAVGPNGKVLSVEASPGIYSVLQSNLRLNESGNVRAVNLAASDEPGVLKMYRASEHNIGMSGLVKVEGGDGDLEFEAEVQAEPLHRIATDEEVSKTRLIKIDVEGAECAVVQGILPLLPKMRKDLEIILEVHPNILEAQGKTPADAMQPFLDAGFHAYRVEEDHLLLTPLTKSCTHPLKRVNSSEVEEECSVILSRLDQDSL